MFDQFIEITLVIALVLSSVTASALWVYLIVHTLRWLGVNI